MLSLMIPDSFLNSCVKEGIGTDTAKELAKEFKIEFGRFPIVYREVLEAIE